MKTISSIKDPIFTHCQKARKKKGNLFLVEDFLIPKASNATFCTVHAILTRKHSFSLATHHISEGMMRRLYPTGKLPEAIALVEAKKAVWSDLSPCQTIVVLEQVLDAGNIGSIIRTSAALGATGVVILSSDPHQLYTRNCIRASMGTLFTHPVIIATKKEFFSFAKEKNLFLLATSPKGEKDLTTYTPPQNQPLALFIGNETNGLEEETIQACNCSAHLLMHNTESLNVAVFTGIALHCLL